MGLFQRIMKKKSSFSDFHLGDAKISVGNGMNLDLTITPDFSQVESR